MLAEARVNTYVYNRFQRFMAMEQCFSEFHVVMGTRNQRKIKCCGEQKLPGSSWQYVEYGLVGTVGVCGRIPPYPLVKTPLATIVPFPLRAPLPTVDARLRL
jgi:hypothetical protein